jgi:putative ATP-dependent endonuclease of OLD family
LDAGGDGQVADLGTLYTGLGKTVYAACDKQEAASEAAMRAAVAKLYMHGESDIEKLVLNNTTQAALERFIDSIQWPSHLTTAFPNPKANATEALSRYFAWSKGDMGLAEYIAQCTEPEIPEWIRQLCSDLRTLYQPPAQAATPPQDTAVAPPEAPGAGAV